MSGFVSFVGAGPGDIGLITEKGIHRLKSADVVLYDRLANPRLLRYTKPDCRLVYCGKLPDRHVMRQEMINSALADYALQYLKVVRLKGGDPSVFGRVGEEAKALKEAGIEYEIVPGVTASVAAASYAGIPVTHRDYSTSFTVRTGHYCSHSTGKINEAVKNADTIAYYMGIKNLPAHCRQLTKDGLPPTTKIAVIEWATTGKQRTVEGTLETINVKVASARIQNPAMVIIGDVVTMRKELAWYEKKPLLGKRLLIAKASPSDSEIERYFLESGAEAYAFPTLAMKKSKLSTEDVEHITRAGRLIFTAPESIDIVMESLLEAGFDARDLPRWIGCLSEKTLQALRLKGIIGHKLQKTEANSVIVGPESQHSKVTFSTHRIIRDGRFKELEERLLAEEEWETVVFPNRSSVDWFTQEARAAGFPLSLLKFAYISDQVKAYAEEKGFQEVDEDIQREIEKWRTTRSKVGSACQNKLLFHSKIS